MRASAILKDETITLFTCPSSHCDSEFVHAPYFEYFDLSTAVFTGTKR